MGPQLLLRADAFLQIVLCSCTLAPQILVDAAFWAARGGSAHTSHPNLGAACGAQHPGVTGLGVRGWGAMWVTPYLWVLVPAGGEG